MLHQEKIHCKKYYKLVFTMGPDNTHREHTNLRPEKKSFSEKF